MVTEKCPHDICDGSGIVTEGQFDDIRDKKCLCAIEAEQVDMDDDSDEDILPDEEQEEIEEEEEEFDDEDVH